MHHHGICNIGLVTVSNLHSDILSGVDVINFILAYKIIATAKKYNEKCNFDKRPIMGFIIRTWTH